MKGIVRAVVFFVALALFSITAQAEQGNCVGRSSPNYHASYFEVCGSNDDDPIIREPFRWMVVWYEMTTVFGSGGEACFDGFSLKVKGTDKNLIPSDFTKWGRWDHAGGNACAASDEQCKNLVLTRIEDPGKWREEVEKAPGSSSAKSLCVKVDKSGKHTHTWILTKPFNLIPLEGIPEGAILEASVWVRTKGDVQARIGVDFFDKKDSRQGRRRAINGKIIQGPHDWTSLTLR